MRAGLLDPARVRVLWEIRLVRAYNRGYRHGWGDAYYRTYRPDPLSGEWSGESVNETLGDLFAEFDWSDGDDETEAIHDLMTEYERGYSDGHTAADPSGEIRAAAIREHYGD